MAVQTTYPGIYIEEFTPGAPIEGVGTSTAAFIGPAASGDLRVPTKITSWDAFLDAFGKQPSPGFFLWYAVRGFFENNGQVCYVVRASNGAYGEAVLSGKSPQAPNLIRVRARQPGNPAAPITVSVADSHVLTNTNTSLFRPAATISAIAGRDLTLQPGEGAQFRPGDFITIAAAGERVLVVRVSGDTLRIGSDLSVAHSPGDAVRLADAPVGTETIRIQSTVPVAPGALGPGTVLTITQGAAIASEIVDSVQIEHLAAAAVSYRVTFRRGLNAAFSLDPAGPAATVQSEEFDLTVSQGVGVTPYPNLSIDAAHPRYFATIVNDDPSGLVRVGPIEPPPPVGPPGNLPAVIAGQALAGGADEDLTTLRDQDFIDALDALRQVDDVNQVAVPDCLVAGANIHPAIVQQAVITHCEQMGDRFAVLDAEPGRALFGANSIEVQRQGLDSTRGYAALYYPWLRVRPLGAGSVILVPPSGHVCGIIARSDATRGVHKAPANEIVSGALGVERTMSDVEQGQLNIQGINAVRLFHTGGRPQLWGARTTATDRNWQYVNVRRLFIFLEQSIERGIRWAVFEPNNLVLWAKLKRTITEFLTTVWRDGALFGATAKDAFYVRIDEVLNPFSEQALGRLHIEIGVRPSYPAEFIVVRIGIWPGGSEITES